MTDNFPGISKIPVRCTTDILSSYNVLGTHLCRSDKKAVSTFIERYIPLGEQTKKKPISDSNN